MGCAMALCAPVWAAEKLVETIPGVDFQVGGTPIDIFVVGSAIEPISGIGFTADWTAIVADVENGLNPFALDLTIDLTAPTGETLNWNPIGGDVTIADYPLQDFKPGLPDVSGVGSFTWRFSSVGPPWIAGLSNVSFQLTTQVPDVVTVLNGSVQTGPQWDRPFFIEGISGLGPVNYHVIRFRVPVGGGYTFHSIVPTGNNFNYIYRGSFDPLDQLTNLFDYGLGNGFGQNGTPQGTSLIEAMLFEGVDYYYVTSQWASFTPGQTFVTTITGPAAIDIVLGDFDGDGDWDLDDYAVMTDCLAGPNTPPTPPGPVTPAQCLDNFDSDADGDVDLDDYQSFAEAFTG